MSGGMTPPALNLPELELRPISGPTRARTENWWRLEAADGSRFALGQLLPELARDEALRRRYVHDAGRLRALDVPGLAAIVALGPAPDPLDLNAIAPWRLRRDPSGQTLADLLDQRAPFPVDEAIELAAELADVVYSLHLEGAVLRDLEPRNVVISEDAELGRRRIVLTDIGLARVDILSTRSASSLMLEGSPYAAPEHLRSTVVDVRADLYTIGAILWHALTGDVPFAEANAFLRARASLPKLVSLGVQAPAGLDELIETLLAAEPEDRPESARDVAETLRGRTKLAVSGGRSLALDLVVCQACGESLRPGMRLCLSCGKQAVQFQHAKEGETLYEIKLLKASEDTEFLAKLRAFFEAVGEGPVPELNFLVGDVRLYSRAEQKRRLKLPTTLIDNLDKPTADRLAKRLVADGFKVKVRKTRRRGRKASTKLVLGGLLGGLGGVVLLIAGVTSAGAALAFGGTAVFLIGLVRSVRRDRAGLPGLAGLRETPAALPASDPLIARLGQLLAAEVAADVRQRVGEIALLVQRLVDHRGDKRDNLELTAIIESLEPVVALVERLVETIGECDSGLADLDEGRLVRAIASSEARDESRDKRIVIYAGLDKLRSLEEKRAQLMTQLLEASSLLRRLAELGLGTQSEQAEDERLQALALATLE